jgi:triosephosphate isomerase (TIM)
MRKPFIAGNWKMNTSRAEAVALATAIAQQAASYHAVDIAICPPACYLEAVAQAVAGSAVGVGAQNVSHENNGAFTGELSTSMLLDVGCKYVILGHSERRQLMGETDAAVNLKLKKTLAAGLVPIVCLGETLAEREAGQTFKVVESQFSGSLAGISAADMAKCVIAYEPVWAIGTGKVATPAQAEEVHAALRKLLETHYNSPVAQVVRIQYGGSVKADNAAELLAQPNIDGALVGGASLKADSFLGIIAGAKSVVGATS